MESGTSPIQFITQIVPDYLKYLTCSNFQCSTFLSLPLRWLLPGVSLSLFCLSYQKLQLRKLFSTTTNFLRVCFIAARPWRSAFRQDCPFNMPNIQFQMWTPLRLVGKEGGWLMVTQLGLWVSQVYWSHWIHVRRYITREHGSLPIWPMALPDWVPLECVLARQTTASQCGCGHRSGSGHLCPLYCIAHQHGMSKAKALVPFDFVR